MNLDARRKKWQLERLALIAGEFGRMMITVSVWASELGTKLAELELDEHSDLAGLESLGHDRPRDAFDLHRAANWRDSLDEHGRPTHGPEEVSVHSCDYCAGPLDFNHAGTEYECPWCIARFGKEVVETMKVERGS